MRVLCGVLLATAVTAEEAIIIPYEEGTVCFQPLPESHVWQSSVEGGNPEQRFIFFYRYTGTSRDFATVRTLPGLELNNVEVIAEGISPCVSVVKHKPEDGVEDGGAYLVLEMGSTPLYQRTLDGLGGPTIQLHGTIKGKGVVDAAETAGPLGPGVLLTVTCESAVAHETRLKLLRSWQHIHMQPNTPPSPSGPPPLVPVTFPRPPPLMGSYSYDRESPGSVDDDLFGGSYRYEDSYSGKEAEVATRVRYGGPSCAAPS